MNSYTVKERSAYVINNLRKDSPGSFQFPNMKSNPITEKNANVNLESSSNAAPTNYIYNKFPSTPRNAFYSRRKPYYIKHRSAYVVNNIYKSASGGTKFPNIAARSHYGKQSYIVRDRNAYVVNNIGKTLSNNLEKVEGNSPAGKNSCIFRERSAHVVNNISKTPSNNIGNADENSHSRTIDTEVLQSD